MARHHGTAVDIDPLPAVFAEIERVVASIIGFPRGGRAVHDTLVGALADFLDCFLGRGVMPWARMYHELPAWQERSGLLDEPWHRHAHAAPEGAQVFFTLVSTQEGDTIRRRALGAGWWKSSGARKTIGDDVVLSKVYLKKDDGSSAGFTAFEFRLKRELQPRVAICVLHPANHMYAIQDLRQYVREERFPGQNQANQPMAQPLATSFFPDPYNAAGLTNDLHTYSTTNPASNSEGWPPAGNQANLQMVQPLSPPYTDPYNVAGLMNDLHAYSTTNSASNSEGWFLEGNQTNLPMVQPLGPSICPDPYSVAGLMNDVDVNSTLAFNSEGWFPNQTNLPTVQPLAPSIYPARNIAGSMYSSKFGYSTNLVPNSEFDPEQYFHAAEMPIQNMNDTTRIQDATIYFEQNNDNEPGLEPIP